MANGKHNPLDINYSLKIGTSVYHVMGKRKNDRKGNYDYYVLDDKLVRTRAPKNHSSKTIKVHGRADETNQTSFSDDKPEIQFNSTELQTALADVMQKERAEYLTSMRAEMEEERKLIQKAFEDKEASLDQQRQELLNLIRENKRIAEENNKKPSTSDVIDKLTDEITKTHQLSTDKVEKLKQELEKLIAKTVETTVNEVQKNSTSLDAIRQTVIGAMNSEAVAKKNIEALEKTVKQTIQEEVNKQKSVKIANLIDANASEAEETSRPASKLQTPRREEEKAKPVEKIHKKQASFSKVPVAAD